MFDVEIVIFAALNIWQPVTSQWLFAFSFLLSIFYMTVIILSVPLVFMVCNKPKELLEDKDYKGTYEAMYEGYKVTDNFSKFFKAFSILRLLSFGLILVFMYYLPLVQITTSMIIAATYLAVLYNLKPHISRREYLIELITESLFTGGNFCFLLFVLDDVYTLYSLGFRVFIGWVFFVIVVIGLMLSITIVVLKIIEVTKNIINYCKNRKKVDGGQAGDKESNQKQEGSVQQKQKEDEQSDKGSLIGSKIKSKRPTTDKVVNNINKEIEMQTK